MALLPDNAPVRESDIEIDGRFRIAQDKKPTEAQRLYQGRLRDYIVGIALNLNSDVEDSREKSLALTALEEALMWAGKAIFK